MVAVPNLSQKFVFHESSTIYHYFKVWGMHTYSVFTFSYCQHSVILFFGRRKKIFRWSSCQKSCLILSYILTTWFVFRLMLKTSALVLQSYSHRSALNLLSTIPFSILLTNEYESVDLTKLWGILVLLAFLFRQEQTFKSNDNKLAEKVFSLLRA